MSNDEFSYDAFGLKNNIKRPYINFISGYKEKYLNPLLISLGQTIQKNIKFIQIFLKLFV